MSSPENVKYMVFLIIFASWLVSTLLATFALVNFLLRMHINGYLEIFYAIIIWISVTTQAILFYEVVKQKIQISRRVK